MRIKPCKIHSRLHPNGRVVYEIDADFTESQRAVVAAAIANIEEVSCVRWETRVCDETPFVRIKQDEEGCFADVGIRTNGRLNLGPGCVV